MNCRFCGGGLKEVLDLGMQPLANKLCETIDEDEMTYSLRLCRCVVCGLAQVDHELPSDCAFNTQYPYFSSMSKSYVSQCEKLVDDLVRQYEPKNVLEIACNDGYLLQHFKKYPHVRAYGIDASSSVVAEALRKDLNVTQGFFPNHFVVPYKQDLIIANNVLAHVPNLNEFMKGICDFLTPNGVFVGEIHDFRNYVRELQYDAIYHEHYSYFEPATITRVFDRHGLNVFHIEQIPSHGGSLRVYAKKGNFYGNYPDYFQVDDFKEKCLQSSIDWHAWFLQKKIKGNSISCFGAAAKGSTFLNYIGIGRDVIDYCVDETPFKQGKFMPGSHIPIVGMERLKSEPTDFLFVLPWNFKEEITQKLLDFGYTGKIVSRL